MFKALKSLHKAKRWRGIVVYAGPEGMGIQPLSILTCHHVEPRQADCLLQRRVAWVIPMQEIPITGLEKALVRSERAMRTDEDGERT